MKFVIETQRFRLRPHSIEDMKFMFDLNSDPEVVKYTGDVSFKEIIETKPIIESLMKQFNERKMGRFVVIDRMVNEKVGWCGLKWSDELQAPDLGYRFYKKYWNKGFATETSTACIEYAKAMGLKELYAFAMKENLASIHVLKKLGFNQVEGCNGVCDQKFKLSFAK